MSLRHVSLWSGIVLGAFVTAAAAAPPENALVDAVKSAARDRTRVAALLKQGADPNGADTYGSTALHWAVELNDVDTVDRLLAAGANPKATNRYGVAPLSLAATNGNAAVIEKLLAKGADANTTAAGGETALMTAARTGVVDAVRALVAHGADLNARETVRGQTALMWAASEGHAEVVRALVKAGADLTARSGRPGAAPARRADNTRPMADYFTRSNGGPLNTPMVVDSMSPLMFAVRDGQTEVVKTLLESGASVNETAANGLSVLVLAIINAHYELASYLLDQGADPNAAGQGWTALHQVVTTPRLSYGRFPHPLQTGSVTPLELAKKLIARGADVNATMTAVTMGDGYRTRLNRLNATPLALAAKGAYPEMMRLLLENGADVNATISEGSTPLMLAAGVAIFNEGDDAGTEAETLEAVKLCVERGADVNHVDGNGETALHGAAYRGHNSVVKYLVERGAKLDVKNRVGWSPLTIADGVLYAEFLKQHRETAALLRGLMKDRGLDPGESAVINEDARPNRRGAGR